MPRIEQVIHCITDDFDHPMDKIAGAVIAQAVYDATNDRRRKTNRNNSNHKKVWEYRKQAARRWLDVHGVYWMDALGMESHSIMEVLCDD